MITAEVLWGIFVQFSSSFVATGTFCVIFNVPKKYILNGATIGAVGWTVYVIMARYMSFGDVFASFVASLIISVWSYILSKRKFAPITLFLIPGIIPLVPGVGMYRTAYYMIFKEYANALESAMTSFQVSGVIAASITLATYVPIIFAKEPKKM
ncbi:MAG: hypothetical protein ATN35_12350 [Epulopiscium sp. Nele67-Bin004]|nr:MAG: hypothetical protein ATN35_12350 [Epulopiscium sp. Nele67-Bin004]